MTTCIPCDDDSEPPERGVQTMEFRPYTSFARVVLGDATRRQTSDGWGRLSSADRSTVHPNPRMGRDVHVTTTTRAISAFMDGDKSGQVCFRCGQTGHMRHSCLVYKVRLCWHHQNGGCYDKNCSFAHGPDELRTPHETRCVRVIKQGGRLICIGCNSTEHTFRRCPHQDLLIL